MWIKCLFGKHDWVEDGNTNNFIDPDDYTRKCSYCNKVQVMYMGDWHTLN